MIYDSKIKYRKKNPLNVKKGFTLIEVLVATFIFVVAVAAASGLFIRAIQAYRTSKDIQLNLEDAQFAMNLLAKTLRTSAVLSPEESGTDDEIKIYDYSRVSDACLSYRFSGGNFQEASFNSDDESACESHSFSDSDYLTLVSHLAVESNFKIILPSSGVAGKTTVLMKFSRGNMENSIQSGVSLRNYEEVAP